MKRRMLFPSRHSHPGRLPSGFVAVLAAAGVCLTAPVAGACGYHNPADMALGLMNWAYPNALHVRTAVWQAEDAGILPTRARTPAKDLFAFNRMLKHLNALGNSLNAAGLVDAHRASFAVVQLDSMLWTRFARTASGYAVETHAASATEGDVVVVTDGKVITAMINGSLDAAAAEKYGLLRYYGPDRAQVVVRRALATATASASQPKQTF